MAKDTVAVDTSHDFFLVGRGTCCGTIDSNDEILVWARESSLSGSRSSFVAASMEDDIWVIYASISSHIVSRRVCVRGTEDLDPECRAVEVKEIWGALGGVLIAGNSGIIPCRYCIRWWWRVS
jgi:hypothetical protein